MSQQFGERFHQGADIMSDDRLVNMREVFFVLLLICFLVISNREVTGVQCSNRRSSCLARKHAWGDGRTGFSTEGLAWGVGPGVQTRMDRHGGISKGVWARRGWLGQWMHRRRHSVRVMTASCSQHMKVHQCTKSQGAVLGAGQEGGGGGGMEERGCCGRTQVQQSHVCIPILDQWHKALLAPTCSHDQS